MAKYEDAPTFLISDLENTLSEKDRARAIKLAKSLASIVNVDADGTVSSTNSVYRIIQPNAASETKDKNKK